MISYHHYYLIYPLFLNFSFFSVSIFEFHFTIFEFKPSFFRLRVLNYWITLFINSPIFYTFPKNEENFFFELITSLFWVDVNWFLNYSFHPITFFLNFSKKCIFELITSLSWVEVSWFLNTALHHFIFFSYLKRKLN